MPSEKKRHIPKFTVANLLVVTAAVAVGFAVSQSPPPDESTAGWSSDYSADMRIPEGFVCAGGVLLIYELVRQTKLLSHQRNGIGYGF